MDLRIAAQFATASVFAAFALAAQAGPIDIVLDPTETYTPVVHDPAREDGEEVTSIAYGGGSIDLQDYGDPSSVTADTDAAWWDGTGPVYTTSTNGIEISFTDLSVVGFTFRIGANTAVRAWVQAFSGGNLIDDTGWFGGIDANTTRGVGVYSSAGSGMCIDRIVIDPGFVWGVGDFTVATDASCNAEAVPIPPAIVLFLSAIAGFGVWGRRAKHQLAGSN